MGNALAPLAGIAPDRLARFGVDLGQGVTPIDAAKFDSRPTWANKGKFDSRPSWDNWSKRGK
ncbi:multiple cyclophane-containing RiPP AmcA [Micromonospora aurantiaca (nom. illeg.)]|uniref:multiple cyclophane-containing RiPP AmcA n=1 Tax=Micromonospora aurantiaca (nom. illeg.) TaxID=47850 RepID=UPI0037A98247